MAINFEWDDKKAKLNFIKHKVTFEEASTAFGDDLSITIEDPFYNNDENRLILIGKSINLKTIVVIHIEKIDSIRIISARKATKKEQKIYEES
ncbi:MAG: BrnT family toxin [Campylobacterota bacterium]|nr:BrnT family toxin [Campylobacterota bacterium]